MTAFVYNSMLKDQANGRINFDADAFKVMLVGGSYVPNKRRHSRRSDITDEVEGLGYDAGGAFADVGLSIDRSTGDVEIDLGGVEWPESTLQAKGAIYYKSRNGTASDDELIAFIGFDTTVMSLMGRFVLSKSIIAFDNA